MALRELLRYPTLERAVLVDLDPAMTELFAENELLARLNGRSFADPRVRVVNADGLKWLETHEDRFDVAVIDLPDPRNFSLSKLYTRGFYRLVHRHLARTGALSVQATTPYGPGGTTGGRSFWCIERTLADAGFTTHPYHCHVPSFGEWGFVLALPRPGAAPSRLAAGLRGLRFLDDATLRALFVFPLDARRPAGLRVNRLNDQVLVHYYEQDWATGN